MLIEYTANLLLPALVMSLLISPIHLSGSHNPPLLGVLGRFGVNAMIGSVVLVGGLIYFGQDGQMLTYGALVLSQGSSQWILSRGWTN
jgi:hypothetical protein